MERGVPTQSVTKHNMEQDIDSGGGINESLGTSVHNGQHNSGFSSHEASALNPMSLLGGGNDADFSEVGEFFSGIPSSQNSGSTTVPKD